MKPPTTLVSQRAPSIKITGFFALMLSPVNDNVFLLYTGTDKIVFTIPTDIRRSSLFPQLMV